MEEEDHFTQTQLPALLLHLQLLQWQQGCCHCSPSLSLYSLHILTALSLSHFALSRMPINRQVWWLLFFNNSSCTWVDTFVNGGCNYHWQMVTLLLRVGCPIMANPNKSIIYTHWSDYNLQLKLIKNMTITRFIASLFYSWSMLASNTKYHYLLRSL